ncbi:hypothetical protein GCM10010336_75720 [Streptomyces goshikiensis]|nr:hypothetical protein GCM10010336_75720 [Streptomyces goshikiensis]
MSTPDYEPSLTVLPGPQGGPGYHHWDFGSGLVLVAFEGVCQWCPADLPGAD